MKVRSDSGHTPGERARIIEQRMAETIQRARSLPTVKILIVDSTPVLESEGIYIMSVTNSDALPENATVAELAATWRDTLEKGIRLAWLESTKGYHEIAFSRAAVALVVGLILSYLAVLICQRWLRLPGFLIVILIWLIVITYILWVFPISRPFAANLFEGVLSPALLASLIIVIVVLLLKPMDSFISHFYDTLEKVQAALPEENKRTAHRIKMLRILTRVGMKMVLVGLAFLFFVNSLKINLTAALTGAGVIGVGLGLAMQELLRDFVTGFFIVLEDQFAVGDVIRTSNMTGTVEEFTFRITRLRDMEGRLITIPNSTIRLVENLSSGWSQVDCSVSVSYGTDLERAMAIMRETAQQLRDDWPEVIFEDPQLLGVEELGESGIRLRIILKTVPLEQWRVRREFLLRLKNRYDLEGIEIPFPQQVVWLRGEGGEGKEPAGPPPGPCQKMAEEE